MRINLFTNIANNRIIIQPNIIGFIKYSYEALPIITIIGFPPAGGWTIFNKIIKKTPKPTPIAIFIYIGRGTKLTMTTPTSAVQRCPKKTFLGWAKGLSGNPNNKTIDEPNEPAIKYPKVLLYVSNVKTPIVIVEKNPAIRAFCKFDLVKFIYSL